MGQASRRGPGLQGRRFLSSTRRKSFFDHALRTVRDHHEKVEYIPLNRVKRGLVKRPEDWKGSSMAEYAGARARKGARSADRRLCGPRFFRGLRIDRVPLPTDLRLRIRAGRRFTSRTVRPAPRSWIAAGGKSRGRLKSKSTCSGLAATADFRYPRGSKAMRRRQNQLIKLVSLFLLALSCWLIGAISIGSALQEPAAARPAPRQGSPVETPWAVYSWGGDPWNAYFPPSCHELSYFSGTPLRFAYGGEIAQWPSSSFKFHTGSLRIGEFQHHRIYQVNQDIQTDPERTHTDEGEYGMKRILVERRPDEFCMIFQEQGALGPAAGIVHIEPAVLTTIDREEVLLTSDLLSGSAADHLDVAWVWAGAAPASLLSPMDGTNSPISDAVQQLLPPGCVFFPAGDPLDLENLTYKSDVWKSTDSKAEPTCGHIELQLGIRNHKLVVLDKRYTPQP